MSDTEEGPGGPPPSYFYTKLRPEGPKKRFLRAGPRSNKGAGLTDPLISKSGSGTAVTSSTKLIRFQRKYQENLQIAQYIYILPVIEMSRPSRDHIAFSQISTDMSSLAYRYFKHDFKQDAKSKPSLTKQERNK